MMIVFWDKDGVLLADYLPCEITINSPYYASMIEQLRSAILEKRRGQVSCGALLLHDNPFVHKSKVVQSVIRQSGFIELNHPAYSLDIAPSDYHLFSNLKKFLRDKNFNSDGEAVIAVEDYSSDRWQRVVTSEGQYIQ